jgi:chromosome partitioning protein
MLNLAVLQLVPRAKQKSVMIFGPKGGLGKTTIAAHLLVAAAKAGYSTLGVDFDPQRTLARWLSDRTNNPTSKDLAQFDLATAKIKDWQDVWQHVHEYDVVVLDMPPAIDGEEAAIFDLTEAADLVLIPSGTSKYDWDIAVEWMGRLKERGLRKARFVINKVPDFRRKSFVRVQTLLSKHGAMIPAVLPLRDDIFLSTDRGLTTIDLCDAKGGPEFELLWNNVHQELGL